MINRIELKNLVSVFYRPAFKIFDINSVDGENFIKPIGIFVSLGITTSPRVLQNIAEAIDSNPLMSAKVVELSSIKQRGQFLNVVTNVNPDQYLLTEFPEGMLDEEAAKKELSDLREKININENLEDLQTIAPKVSKLSELIKRLDDFNSWDLNYIRKGEDGDYSIFHKFVNYKKVDDIEYHIGICVVDKE